LLSSIETAIISQVNTSTR